MLYTDAMVCEDSLRHDLPLSVVDVDYEKFFNTLARPAVDAVEECRGVPGDARALLHEAFGSLQVAVETRWGPSPLVVVARGMPQGSVSGPEASKPAQEPVLRAREQSNACYTTSCGRRVFTVVYVDDGKHYGAGARHIPTILGELGAGGGVGGIGFAWPKCSAFASDWGSFCETRDGLSEGFSQRCVRARGFDIWSGEYKFGEIPRITAASITKSLGKRGSVADRHGAARKDLEDRLSGIRSMINAKRMSWDESAAVVQLVVRGVLAYVPLIGVLSHVTLHAEDAAFQRLVLAKFGVRLTAERVSLMASRSAGGAQLASVVESVASPVARDLLTLLNNKTMAGLLARDSLREALEMSPEDAEAADGLILIAMRFLAGYGIYVGVSTDRTVCRILDALARSADVLPQVMVNPWDHRAVASGLRWCRVGRTANSIRAAVHALRVQATPLAAWSAAATWVPVLSAAVVCGCCAGGP
jgi:hypothetical protein